MAQEGLTRLGFSEAYNFPLGTVDYLLSDRPPRTVRLLRRLVQLGFNVRPFIKAKILSV